MNRWMLTVALSLGLCFCSLGNAATTWYFSPGPTSVDLGTNTASFSASIGSGPTIAASGFANGTPPTARNLYEKFTTSPTNDESGLGFKNEIDHEIDTNGFVVLDLSNSFFTGQTLSLYITSIQSGESYAWYHGSSLNSSLNFDGLTQGGTGLSGSPLVLGGGGTDKFIAIEASNKNVLLNSLVTGTAVPEPSFYGLLLAGLLSVMIVRHRRRVTQ
jgi:hypothetical protein